MIESKKYALVTGGSRGIGRACCLALAAEGYHILLNYLSNQLAAEAVKAEVEGKGVKCELLPYNVSKAEEVMTAIEGWYAAHSDCRIEVLVNNAGIRKDNLMFWMSDEEWDSVVDTSLDGAFYTTREVVKQMMAQKSGRIINIVSLSGIKGMPGQINYSAAKAGVIGLTKALAQECAKKRVTVNAIAPGFIETDMTQDLDEASFKKMIPMGRFGQADEVASLVVYLASKSAGYITGEVISMNGGIYT